MSPTSIKHNKFTRAVFAPIRFIVKKISKTGYVKLEYRYVTGHKLHLNNPVKYSEKLQYLRLKVYPNDSLVVKCASRMGGRDYVNENGFDSYLPKLYGTYKSFKDIDFSLLPNSFVMKCNHGSGYVVICYDKTNFDFKKANKEFTKWLKIDYGKKTVEPHYSPSERFIIIEELLQEDSKLPTEYKIHCFNGQAKSLYVVTNRGSNIRYNNFYIDWKPFEESQFNHWKSSQDDIKKPSNFDEMIMFANKVSKPFPFVRVDLYNINGKIYFSEFTFTPAKGTLKLANDKTDIDMGKWLEITK